MGDELTGEDHGVLSVTALPSIQEVPGAAHLYGWYFRAWRYEGDSSHAPWWLPLSQDAETGIVSELFTKCSVVRGQWLLNRIGDVGACAVADDWLFREHFVEGT